MRDEPPAQPAGVCTVVRVPPLRSPVGEDAGPDVAGGAPGRRPRRVNVGLLAALAISVVALGARVIGLGYGLPFHYHWDEPTVMNRVVRMGGGDLNPHFFYYPSLLMYLLLGMQGSLYAAGHALHVYPSTESFAATYLTDSTTSYLVGRGLVAALGAATVLLCYAVGRRFLSAPAALIGALLLAVSPVHIGSSHFITNDVPMAFFALLAYLFLWRVYTRGRGRDYVATGVAVGLGMSTKYLPVVLLFSLVLAHIFRLRITTGMWRSARHGVAWVLAGVGAAALTFALTSPYVLLDWRSALHDYRVQASLSSAQGCRSCPLNVVPYLTHTLGWSVGWPAYMLSLVAVASLVRMRGEPRLRAILFASFPIMMFVMIGLERQPWPRWLVPIAPFACLAAGGVLWNGLRRLAGVRAVRGVPGRRASSWALGSLTAAVLIGVTLPPALASARFDRSLILDDPRTQAVRWLEGSVPAGTTIAVQPMLDHYFFTAQPRTDLALRSLESWLPRNRRNARRLVDEEFRTHPVYHEAPFSYSLHSLQVEGVRYVVLSSAHYHNIDPAGEDRLYGDLARGSVLSARFTPPAAVPDADDYPVSMPTISVYALPPASGS
jgi:hypothetical protein